mgnify:CR=1 FL=1
MTPFTPTGEEADSAVTGTDTDTFTVASPPVEMETNFDSNAAIDTVIFESEGTGSTGSTTTTTSSSSRSARALPPIQPSDPTKPNKFYSNRTNRR